METKIYIIRFIFLTLKILFGVKVKILTSKVNKEFQHNIKTEGNKEKKTIITNINTYLCVWNITAIKQKQKYRNDECKFLFVNKRENQNITKMKWIETSTKLNGCTAISILYIVLLFLFSLYAWLWT